MPSSLRDLYAHFLCALSTKNSLSISPRTSLGFFGSSNPSSPLLPLPRCLSSVLVRILSAGLCYLSSRRSNCLKGTAGRPRDLMRTNNPLITNNFLLTIEVLIMTLWDSVILNKRIVSIGWCYVFFRFFYICISMATMLLYI